MAELGSRSDTERGVWAEYWRASTERLKIADEDYQTERNSSRWRRIHAHLLRKFGAMDGIDVLELGAGAGDYSLLLGEQGANPTLLDYSKEALILAKERLSRNGVIARTHIADVRSLPEGLEGSFDVSVSIGLVEHFIDADRQRVIEVHRAALRPGGVAIICVPNAWCVPYRLWKARLQKAGRWSVLEVPFSPFELGHRARQARFRTVKLAGSYFWPYTLRFVPVLHRLLPRFRSEITTPIDKWFGYGLIMIAET